MAKSSVDMIQLLVLTAALRHSNKGRERLSRQYLELLYCFYLLTLDKPEPLYKIAQKFNNTLYIAGYGRMKGRANKLIQLGYIEEISTGKSRPQYVYQITIAGVNRLKELEDAAAYLVKLAKKRMKK